LGQVAPSGGTEHDECGKILRMTLRWLDGARVARTWREELRHEVTALGSARPKPGLAVVIVGDDPASAIYVRNKTKACEEVGIRHETHTLPRSASTERVVELVARLNERDDVHGVLVQQPLPPQVAVEAIVACVDPRKDVDCLHPENVGLVVQKRQRFVPCTPGGIMEMLSREGIEVAGRRAVVVGRSDIVGKPMAMLLLHAHATVTICHTRTGDLAAVTREADILVVAVGRAGVIGAGHVKPGAVVVDVGMNRISDRETARRLLSPDRFAKFEKNGTALVGDVVQPAVAEVAGALTPVPGGVGPLTIATLMRNTIFAAKLG
jgi:methylenetetrahydrofolate dehydrogenase (NADP+)/methenyltetrahydrofolate cyclohydrolase